MGQRGTHSNPVKKDRQSVEGVRQEILEESRGIASGTLQRNRNRDAARGDSDRTNRRHDEGTGRDDQPEPGSPDRYPGSENE